jgi:tetratricopeptide (TPR) repeat protein
VTGALGVMEINGILTKMMFDHDSPRRAFYVEESYVIPWMYPYLSPHGLIMKINAARTPYSAATAAKDRDFWDWYVRRLLKDPMYRRDFAGQKSFSKLRAALAGLYLNQGRRGEAAQAYREACLLYPASPEATFRYAQEVLFPVGAWDQVLELMDYTDRLDPKNRRTAPLRNYVTRLRHFNGEISRLEAKRRAQTITREELVMLASDYYAVGRVSESADIFASRLADATSPDELLTIATVLMEANRAAGAEEAYGKYLKAAPQPVIEAWFSMARLQHRSGRRQAALRSIQMALKTDRARFIDVVQKDRELLEIAQPLFQRR